MGLSVRAYARHRGVSHVAVLKALRSGRIVVGADGAIDPAVADRTWQERTAARMPPPAVSPEPAPGALGVSGGAGVSDAGTYYRARAAALIVDVQTKRLALEQRRGALIAKDRAVLKAFSFARMLRDRWLAWPARVGPLLAAQFELDAGTVTVVVEGLVREHLEELASERCEF
jgi:hypothetical protein